MLLLVLVFRFLLAEHVVLYLLEISHLLFSLRSNFCRRCPGPTGSSLILLVLTSRLSVVHTYTLYLKSLFTLGREWPAEQFANWNLYIKIFTVAFNPEATWSQDYLRVKKWREKRVASSRIEANIWLVSGSRLQGLSTIPFWQRVHVSFTMKRFTTKRLYLTRVLINVRSVETFVSIRDF